ncbi:hypothetical protein QE197_01480 [Arsenophonus nasoniae]|uniref:Phage transcriptional regulator n=1 Tax=Arsenophonus nasoniae TaxID=638 RepID=A0A4P7KWV5_9GAMM|nr:hypothetical protein [Arsenophonus nasoniae]QBY41918.1 hypothetical protein ArsFIN_04500 [Arsenophonus nasoniae]WGM06128.1 hypothetical protein QE258_01740 [Arsenophonus nasoniae]WGM11090.1 hypothetical protein QE197_01480 [Arsenophonus nasoniae]WGM15791.1 hypothetical protein QE193_01460 [Arsenophonus nasoniae]
MKHSLLTHEFFCWRVAEAYMYYLMATNRRPVYRYETGDIEVSRHFLMPLLDGYLGDRKTTEWRAKFYVKLMTPFSEKADPRAIICAGKIPQLNRRGIKYMNALLHEFGDMLSDIGVKDNSGMLILPRERECTNL